MNKWKKELKNSSNIVYFSYETSQRLNRCVSKNWSPTIEVLENVKHLTFSVWTVQEYFKIYVNVFIQVFMLGIHWMYTNQLNFIWPDSIIFNSFTFNYLKNYMENLHVIKLIAQHFGTKFFFYEKHILQKTELWWLGLLRPSGISPVEGFEAEVELYSLNVCMVFTLFFSWGQSSFPSPVHCQRIYKKPPCGLRNRNQNRVYWQVCTEEFVLVSWYAWRRQC